MSNRGERNLVGNACITHKTPDGSIRLSIRVDGITTADAKLARQYLPCINFDQLITTLTQPSRTALIRTSGLEDLRRRNEIFAMIPPKDVISGTTLRAINALSDAGVRTLQKLASLTDEELAGIKGSGRITTPYIRSLRELAQDKQREQLAANKGKPGFFVWNEEE